MQRTHRVVVVLVRDPDLDVSLQTPIESEESAYLRAAAEMIDHDRCGFVSELRSHGILVVDTDLAALGDTLLTTYLRLKH